MKNNLYMMRQELREERIKRKLQELKIEIKGIALEQIRQFKNIGLDINVLSEFLYDKDKQERVLDDLVEDSEFIKIILEEVGFLGQASEEEIEGVIKQINYVPYIIDKGKNKEMKL